MKTLPIPSSFPILGKTRMSEKNSVPSSSFATRMRENSVWNAVTKLFISLGKRYVALTIIILGLLTLFISAGSVLRAIDPVAGILDIGILSVLLFGLLGAAVAIFVSLWLQEILWRPFKLFRKQFHSHFNQLTPWQQSILYFSVFFLLLYAALWALEMVL